MCVPSRLCLSQLQRFVLTFRRKPKTHFCFVGLKTMLTRDFQDNFFLFCRFIFGYYFLVFNVFETTVNWCN